MVVILKAAVSPIKKQGNTGYCFSVKGIGEAINNNLALFDKLVPPPDEGLEIIMALDAANTKAAKGSKEDKATRNELRKSTDKILNSWAAGVTLIANGNEEIIAKSKFPVAKKSSPVYTVPVPQSPAITDGNGAGKVKSKTKAVKGATGYQARYTSKDPATAVDSDYTELAPGGTKTEIANLVPGTIYFFSVRAIGARSTSGWSEPTMFMPSKL